MRAEPLGMWCTRFAVSLAAHILTAARWKGYSSLQRSERLQWCNKIACGIHVGCAAAAC